MKEMLHEGSRGKGWNERRDEWLVGWIVGFEGEV
jgi:hypothetical protein